MKDNLLEIEKRLRTFFEDTLDFVGEKSDLYVATRKALEAQTKTSRIIGNRRFSPDIFKIGFKRKPDEDEQTILNWKEQLSIQIKNLAEDQGLLLRSPIQIDVSINPDQNEDVEIITDFSRVDTSKTTDILIIAEETGKEESSISAYLITPEETIFEIRKKVINIGREEKNDLVIDNLLVSRVHAQIREIKHRHVLFDLDSTSGTRVNHRAIYQQILTHGDVIEIADVPIVYGVFDGSAPAISAGSKTKMVLRRVKNK